MFYKTIKLDEMSKNPVLLSEMKDGQVLQVNCPGQDTKVMMTQEYYLELMGKLEKNEGSAKVTKYDPETLMTDFEKRVKSDV